MGAIVTMLNQKGGVGKTSVTLGLASAAMEAGRRVLVVDLDPQGSSTWVLGDPELDGDRVGPTVDRLLSGGGASAAARAVQPSGWGDGVDVVASRPDLARWEPASGRDATRLRTALLSLVDGYDAILVDCPPSLGHLTRAGLAAADLAVIVVEPSALGLRGVHAVADTIDEVWEDENPDLDLAGVIVNKVPGVSAEAERRVDELVSVVGRRAIWKPMIPQRVIASQAIAERRAIHSYGWRAADLIETYDALWSKLGRRAKQVR
jgi:cellulose biosynthesis protein BcsQ